MEQIAMLLMAGVGVACIYIGYQLFCGLPAIAGSARSVSRTRVFLMNVVPGALLALIGAGILTAETRNILPHRHAAIRQKAAPEGVSWHPAKSGYSRAA